MPGISVHYDIQKALEALIKAQCGSGVLANIAAANVKVRMLPKRAEKLDTTLPLVVIAPYGAIDWEPDGFEDTVNNTYYVEICIVSAGNLDMATNQEEYSGWLEEIGRIATAEHIPSVPSMWRAELVNKPVFDRSDLNRAYAYQSILVVFDSHEDLN